MIDYLLTDPMFWAVMIALNLVFLVNDWKQERDAVIMKFVLLSSLVANSVVLGISLNYAS